MMSTFRQKADDVRQRAASGQPPKLPITYVNVRPLKGAVVYTIEGVPIPQDEWSTVPVSAGVVNAIKYGDLEEGEAEKAEPHEHHHRRRRHHADEASG